MRRRTDALAAKVAETINADIFITEREYLHGMTWTLADGVTYCTIEDALAGHRALSALARVVRHLSPPGRAGNPQHEPWPLLLGRYS